MYVCACGGVRGGEKMPGGDIYRCAYENGKKKKKKKEKKKILSHSG